jgi:pimeloyl-ACP methyl ester carboxylesterase
MSADRYLQAAGARLRYRDEGSGPPVVLLHGWTLDLEMWEPQVQELRRRFRMVSFDRRGFGLSSGTPDIEADASDARALCHELGVRRAAFVGMSQGARILERLIVESPALVACVVFDGAPDMRPGGTLTIGDIPLAKLRKLAKTEGLAAFRSAWAEHPLSKLVTPDAGMHVLLRRILDRYPGNDLLTPAGIAAVPAIAGVPTSEATPDSTGATRAARRSNSAAAPGAFTLERVQVPALVLTGELDLESRRRAADLLASLLPRAERIVIPRAGHIANLDNPRAYNGSLARFLERTA